MNHVAELQAQGGHRGHLEVGAGDAGDGNVEALSEVQFAHRLAEDFAIGDEDAPEGDTARRQDEVFVAVGADDLPEPVEPAPRADRQEQIVSMDDG
jgi:hypothetical protein